MVPPKAWFVTTTYLQCNCIVDLMITDVIVQQFNSCWQKNCGQNASKWLQSQEQWLDRVGPRKLK